MHIPRVYQACELAIGCELALDQRACHHLTNVLRLREGAPIILFNGQGGEYAALLIQVKKKNVIVKVREFHDSSTESKLSIHLGQAISRSAKMDFALQKAVELGVTQITPLITQYCAIKISTQQLEKKYKHWQGIIINACEQSGRARIPILHKPCRLTSWKGFSSIELGLLLEPKTTATLHDIIQKPQSLALLIGPEGGLSTDEVALMKAQGVKAISLGPRILRTETATVCALSILQARWGDLA